MTKRNPALRATFDRFYGKWLEEFRIQEKKMLTGTKGDRFWDGTTAFKTLHKAGALWIVMPPTECGDFMPKILLRRLFREVRLYRHYRDKIIGTNKAFDDAIETLSGAQQRLEKAVGQVFLPELKSRLGRNALYLDKEIDALRDRRQAYWKEAFLEEPTVRMKWPVEVNLRPHMAVNPIPPEDLVEWEKTLHRVKYPDTPEKRIDLDARFQKRIAIILRFYFQHNPSVPLSTISRLVVLVYISADLAGEVDGHLMILDETGLPIRKDKKLDLTVSSVDQKIRNIGL